MRFVLVLIAAIALMGCRAKSEPVAEVAPVPPAGGDAQTSSQGGGEGGPTPVSPALGGASPVVGAQALQGGGGSSAVGQMAKDRARSFASDASPTNQLAEADGE